MVTALDQQPDTQSTVRFNPQALAQQTADLLYPHVACNPVIFKACYQHRNDAPGVYGDFTDATGYAMHPVKGSLFKFADCDDPALAVQILASIPRLADGYIQRRGDHSALGFVPAYRLPNTSIKGPDKHEIFSLRGDNPDGLGQYQVGSGSIHYIEVAPGEWQPSGDVYQGNGKRPITLTTGETDRLAALIAAWEPEKRQPKPAPTSNKLLDVKDRQPTPDEDFEMTRAALAVLDPDMCRVDWWKIGAALAYSFGDRGIAEFEAWSAGSKQGKYEHGEPTYTARSFKHGVARPKTFKYVLGQADDARKEWRKEYYARRRDERKQSSAKAENSARVQEADPQVQLPEPAQEIVTQTVQTAVEPVGTTTITVDTSVEPVHSQAAAQQHDAARNPSTQQRAAGQPAQVECSHPTPEPTIPETPAPDLAAGSQVDSFITTKITLGDMVRLLNDEPKQAVMALPRSENRSERSARRDRAAKFINSNYSPVNGNRTVRLAADRHFPATWIRNVFPQGDPLTALIPARLLTPELFADALTADEIDDLGDLAFMVDLTGKQRKAVEDRIRLLNLIRRKANELDRVPFVIEDGQTFDKVADLRPEVLRQACRYFATDQATGEITEAALSNTIQACLIGTTIGALPSVRLRAGIEQIPQAVQEKAITSPQQLPPNAYETFTRSGQLYAKVQPVSRQRVGDRPEPKPRAERQRKGSVITHPLGHSSENPPAEPNDFDISKSTPPTPRRPWREVYAARLMRNLLHHAQTEADEAEPLDLLAGKLRNLIKSTPGIETGVPQMYTDPGELTEPPVVIKPQPPTDELIPALLIDIGGTLTSIEESQDPYFKHVYRGPASLNPQIYRPLTDRPSYRATA